MNEIAINDQLWASIRDHVDEIRKIAQQGGPTTAREVSIIKMVLYTVLGEVNRRKQELGDLK